MLLSFWDQVWMSPCSWAELVRELRFFWGSSGGDCSGIGLGTAALLALLSWLGGCIFGLICASLVFSHSCRRAYFFSSKAGLHFWDQTPLGILVCAQFNCALGWGSTALVDESFWGRRRAHYSVWRPHLDLAKLS